MKTTITISFFSFLLMSFLSNGFALASKAEAAAARKKRLKKAAAIFNEQGNIQRFEQQQIDRKNQEEQEWQTKVNSDAQLSHAERLKRDQEALAAAERERIRALEERKNKW